MDDKTAKIPSLKEFEDARQGRAVHNERSRSMQTKNQMKRGSEKQSAKAKTKAQKGVSDSTRLFSSEEMAQTSQGRPQRKPSKEQTRRSNPTHSTSHTKSNLGETRVFDTPVQRTQKSAAAKGERRNPTPRGSASDIRHTGTDRMSTRRTSSAKGQAPAERKTSAKRPAPAPETYARERNSRSSGQAVPHREMPSQRPAVRKQSAVTPDKNPKKPPKVKKPLSPGARKFRSFIAYFAIVLVVLIVGVVLSLTVLFKTEQINVSGNGEYSVQEIIDASGLNIGENIFTAPKSRASEKIEKAYPYVEEADVYAAFPNAINIDLTMAKPACVVEALGGYYVVSDKGKVLEVAATTDEIDAPVIEGITVEGKSPGEYVQFGSDVIGTALEEMFAAFREFGCTKITAINVSTADDDTVEIKYVYDDRIVVYIGIPEHINYKIQTAHTIITEKIDVNGATLAGDLDVSMCYESKKSYFNQYTILAPNSVPVTEATDSTDTAYAPAETEAVVYENNESYNSGYADEVYATEAEDVYEYTVAQYEEYTEAVAVTEYAQW